MLPLPRRLAAALPALTAALVLAPVAAVTASCAQILGIDEYFDCPGDARCASCKDGKANGDETGVDCGGPTCPNKCGTGQGCKDGADCENGVCEDGKCKAPPAPTCDDGVKNGAETDVDCGGSCSKGCATGKGCKSGADCASQVCAGASCSPPSCTDGKHNGDETDVDCGGSCPQKCADGKVCAAPADCVSGLCDAGTCKGASCGDGTKNGDESDVDCGGSCPDKCADGKACGGAADCASLVCTGGTCTAATCSDGVKNEDESDVDCGGATCPKCAVPQTCGVGADCETGVCQAGKCGEFFVWGKQFGDSSYQFGRSVATDALGNAYIASWVQGTVDFGGGALSAPTGSANNYLGIAKLDPTGVHDWSKVFPAASATVFAIATDAAGNSVVTGAATNGANFGAGALTGGGANENLFYARFDTGGNHLASKLFANSGGRGAAAGTYRYAVAGYASKASSIDFGCGSLPTSGAWNDAVVAAFQAGTNTCAWSKRYGMPGQTSSFATAIAADVDSNFLVVIEGLTPAADLGCGPITFPAGPSHHVLAKLGEVTGNCMWNVPFGDTASTPGASLQVSAVGVDANGNVTIAGTYSGRVDIGPVTFTNADLGATFLAQFDKIGTFRWAKQFTNAGSGCGTPPTLSVSAAGKLTLGGMTSAGCDFGGGPLPSDGPFGAEFDPSGQHLWSHGFVTVNQDWTVNMISGVAYAGENEVVVAGGFPGQIDLGNGPLTTKGSFDIFLAKLTLP